MRYVHIAITLSIILLSSSFGFNSVSAATVTTLSFDRLPYNFPVTQGNTVFFNGRLIEAATVSPIANATINIVHQVSYANQKVLVSGSTDADGFYTIPWVVDVEKVAPVTGGSFGMEQTQGRENRFQVQVFAQFQGDNKFAQSVSTAQSFEVKLNQIRIFIDKKPTYLIFESFTVGVRIADVDGNLIDPDKLTASYDNNPITLVRNSVGAYSFTISSLAPGPHLFKVSVDKKGFVSDQQLVTIEGTKRKTSLIINTDKSTYQLEDTVTVTARLLDTSANVLVSDRPIAVSVTSPNLSTKALTLAEGKATFGLTRFDQPGTWSISASFAGDSVYFGTSGSASFTVEKAGVVKPPPPLGEKVSLGSISLVDQQGSRLRSVSVGQQVMIEAKITSNFDTDEEVAYISQVKDADGITVALSWITGTISPGQSLELAISWLPDKPGEYTAEVFVWKDVRTAEPLSFEVKRSTIIVK